VHHRIKEKEGEKISGPEPLYLDKWWEDKIADYFLVEADGAAGRSVKAPASHEPVICESTTDLIGVIGIDALGLPLEEKKCFSSPSFQSIDWYEKLKEKNQFGCYGCINLPSSGLIKSAPLHSKCHLFINKVDDELRKKIRRKNLQFKYYNIIVEKSMI